MITLFIDTSASDVSIAIIKDEKIISKIVKNIPNEHSVYAVKFVNDVLETIEMKPNDIDNIINEAVELAKKYGEDSSKNFVNGILASIVNK